MQELWDLFLTVRDKSRALWKQNGLTYLELGLVIFPDERGSFLLVLEDETVYRTDFNTIKEAIEILERGLTDLREPKKK